MMHIYIIYVTVNCLLVGVHD